MTTRRERSHKELFRRTFYTCLALALVLEACDIARAFWSFLND